MAYHTVLSKSEDFVNAMLSANTISNKITEMLNQDNNSTTKYEVFPYRLHETAELHSFSDLKKKYFFLILFLLEVCSTCFTNSI
jgi:hypothetical protein